MNSAAPYSFGRVDMITSSVNAIYGNMDLWFRSKTRKRLGSQRKAYVDHC
jgi:hypothetical protein